MVLNKQWEIWFRNKSKYFMNIGRWMPLYVEYIMRNAGLEETQAGIKIAGRNINNSDMQMTPPLWQKVKRN